MNANVLLDMNNQPITWKELHRRRELFYLLRELEEQRAARAKQRR